MKQESKLEQAAKPLKVIEQDDTTPMDNILSVEEGQTQGPVAGMKLLIDFINDFRADKKLKYSIACNVQAYLARFGVDISDNVRQKFQDDKCAEDLVDEVLDDMLNKVYEAKSLAPIKTEGEDEWKEKFKDWLVNNMQFTSKSNVEIIADHVERYIRPSASPSPVGIDVDKLAKDYAGKIRDTGMLLKRVIIADAFKAGYAASLNNKNNQND